MKFRALQWDYHAEAVLVEREMEERNRLRSDLLVEDNTQEISPIETINVEGEGGKKEEDEPDDEKGASRNDNDGGGGTLEKKSEIVPPLPTEEVSKDAFNTFLCILSTCTNVKVSVFPLAAVSIAV